MGDGFGAQPIDEVVDGHPALDLAAAWVHADRAVAHVVVADDEHIRDLLELRLADACAERLVGFDLVGAEALGAESVGEAIGVRVVVSADAEQTHLHRREPQRQRAGVVLERGSPKKRSTEPNSARWITRGRWRWLSGPMNSRSNRSGNWKSTCSVDICQRRPIASRTCTSIFGA